MKLKQRPDDFRVEEITSIVPAPTGSFAYYRLEKRGWTTPDALAAVCRRWKIDSRRLSYGGLKDRHAHTIQYLTILNGPEKNLRHETFDVTYLGRVGEPFTSELIGANAFTLVLRSMTPVELARAEAALPELADVGVANYFDDQRFGSVSRVDVSPLPAAGRGVGGEGLGATSVDPSPQPRPRNGEEEPKFVAREMVLGNFEQALRLALAEPYEHDPADAKREKLILTARWGDWPAAKAELPRGHARDIVDYLLDRPTDFRGACARLRPELHGLYLAAWQSHLWNQMLSRWLDANVPPELLMTIALKTAAVNMPRTIPPALRDAWDALVLPLPSARLQLDPDVPYAGIVRAVMDDAGVPLEQMRIRGMHRPFFSKGNRVAKLTVSKLSWSIADDELNRSRHKLELRFELGRGSYATMVVKRLTG